MEQRIAEPADAAAITETVALAFLHDPVWGPALARDDGGTDHLVPFWRFLVESAVRHGHVSVASEGTTRAATAAVWLPPDVDELTADEEEQVDALMAAALTPASFAAYQLLWTRFEENHPHDRPHMYLSLLATHPDHRGRGIGQQLLAADLARFDAVGLPAYLESTNPANDHRYERAGFRPIGSFRAVLDDAVITQMWREPSGT